MARTGSDESAPDPTNPRVVRDDVCDGEPRIAGRRVTVLHLYEQVEGRGLQPGVVADRHDLDVADVYRALAYYHEHPEEMESVRERRADAVSAAFDTDAAE